MNEVNVMEEIRKIEEAQAEYKRQTFRDGIAKGLRIGTDEQRARAMVDAMLPIRNMLENNDRQEFSEVRRVQDAIVDNLDIHETEFKQRFEKEMKRLGTELKNHLDDVETAYATAVADLEHRADPFNGEFSVVTDKNQLAAWKSDLTNFMLQTTLTGGLPKGAIAIHDAVKAAIESKDPGAIQFWVKNFGPLFDNAPIETRFAKDHEQRRSEIVAGLEKALDLFRSQPAKDAAARLRNVKSSWALGEVPKMIAAGRANLKMHGGALYSIESNYKKRDEKQRQIAEKRWNLRKAQAELSKVGG